MLERSALAENALQALHDEEYDTPFNVQNLNAATMIFVGGRQGRSLNGAWNFCIDPLDTGLRQKWYEMQPMRPEDRTEPWDYDPYAGETTSVPSNWNMQREKWYMFEGSAWYTRALDVAELPDDRRQFLRVGAAQYDCKVFLNGVFVGNHYGGSTPFFAELTGRLRRGRNWLMLCVNNSRTRDRVPMRNTDWFNYGGVYREVSLIETPTTVIRHFHLSLVPDQTFSTLRAVVIAEGPDTGRATLSIPELGVATTFDLDERGQGEAFISVRPQLWSPDTPKLYDVTLRVGPDCVSDRVGFREIRREGTEILLNGESIFLRGISVHEDDEKEGKVTSEADLRRRFRHARELGCNFVRLAHYPHHERAAELADEMGFLLWEEIPVYWAIDFDNPATLQDAENQLRELVRRDANRASVIIWSVGNENPDTDARLAFMCHLAAVAKAEDPSRLTAAACLVNHEKNRIDDRLMHHIDVVGLNEYYGWYEEDFENLVRIGRNSNLTRPVVVSETGADGAIGEGAPTRGLFSESYMAEVYRRQIDTLKALPYLKGISPWILYDFRTERRQNQFQRGFNRKGLIAADKKTKKSAFDLLAEFYRKMAGTNDKESDLEK